MERFDTRKMATKKTVVFESALVLAALLLLATFAGRGRPASGGDSPVINPDGETVSPPEIPDDDTLRLTVPAMARVNDLPVGTGSGDDEATLAESALHVEDTGFPWEEWANVYTAGHRLVYEGEASHLAFHDLDVLQNGDEVILTAADGTRYTYRVFRSFVVGPRDYTSSPSPFPARAWSACRPAPSPTTQRGSSCRPNWRTPLPEKHPCRGPGHHAPVADTFLLYPQPRNSVGLSTPSASLTMRRTLEGLGVSIV